MVYWPCILKLNGDDELIYLGSEVDFIYECRELIFSDEDYIIDSAGLSYVIELILGKLTLVRKKRIFIVNEVTELIRANEFSKAKLCLTKIHFLTVSDAIQSLLY